MTGKMRGKINNLGGGVDGVGWGVVASLCWQQSLLTEEAAGSLIWAIYTPVRPVKVPANQAVLSYAPDTSLYTCGQNNAVRCICIYIHRGIHIVLWLYSTGKNIFSYSNSVTPIWLYGTCICITTVHTEPILIVISSAESAKQHSFVDGAYPFMH